MRREGASEEPCSQESETETADDVPRLFILATHLSPEEHTSLRGRIPLDLFKLTRDAREADFVVGNITRRQRAQFELRRVRVDTETVEIEGNAQTQERPLKRRKFLRPDHCEPETVKVLRLDWLDECLREGKVTSMNGHLIYEGRKTLSIQTAKPAATSSTDAGSPTNTASSGKSAKPWSTTPFARPPPSRHVRSSQKHRPPLLQQTTSEHDFGDFDPIPSFLSSTYSCERPTPMKSPNADFIEALGKVRLLRQLQGDQIGVRAYSTSIATLAAYPQRLKNPNDVARLPGCGEKIAVLYQQWIQTGELQEISSAATDERLNVLELFYNIWGVGDTTASEFYKKGWRDLADVVEHGWDSLSRVQQIGVKFYDEFLLKIPRDEVEAIGHTILKHARRLDPGFDIVIVGGYRRGKLQSGDVDAVLSHRDENRTTHCIEQIVMSLENAELITHTLSLSTANSDRDQRPVPWRGQGGSRASGFDTLDKAMVVWQDTTADKNAPHRRVDIIVSPWKTVGCAVLGWSGGTTFQRDLRRYCKHKALKFDSSGIRSRADGAWVDFESLSANSDGPGTEAARGAPAPDMETAERRVFAGLGLPWRRPEERCTG